MPEPPAHSNHPPGDSPSGDSPSGDLPAGDSPAGDPPAAGEPSLGGEPDPPAGGDPSLGGEPDPPAGGEPSLGGEPDPPSGGQPDAPQGPGWGQAALNADQPGAAGVLPDGGPPAGSPDTAATGAHYGGSAGAGRPGPAQRTGPKPIRGPRFSASPLVAGLGLLSLLVVIAIMALLAVKVLGSTDASVTTRVGEGAATDDLDTKGAISGGKGADNATASSCRTDKATIETAAAAYFVSNEQHPTSVDDLVAEGWLKENPETYTLEVNGDEVSVVGTGVCEGIG